MSRYVVVEFGDNAEADAFIKAMDEENAKRRKEGDDFIRRVAGLFVKPGRTCVCTDRERSNYGDKNWKLATIARGEKFGWWVCTRCNRPRAAGHQLVNQVPLANLYEGVIYADYEFEVTGLDVTGIHTQQVHRDKKLRPKKRKLD